MVLVLAIGDLHIPDRAADIPSKFRKLLARNLCDNATFEYLRTVSTNLHISKGDCDYESRSWPQSKVITHGPIRIGVTHGHHLVPTNGDVDTLASVARQMNVDILLTGHTHRFEAYEDQGRFYINPGSATGSYSPYEPRPVPSFVLMDIQGTKAIIYVYQLIDNEVKVDRIEYQKGASLP
ncbi:Vacuolar protein sorting-associated protein 29 [Mycoemilia scoparia]|uniref:Vacuolar protein sorting-associated protein 29 n=1 Tax=Mycoemilia scoparia TaxID=417184 RepID=A0A9W8AA50_9FUNG|nr:Vacuolar protein sorting-associated protein 29 [Mycoemilia scoparia]